MAKFILTKDGNTYLNVDYIRHVEVKCGFVRITMAVRAHETKNYEQEYYDVSSADWLAYLELQK